MAGAGASDATATDRAPDPAATGLHEHSAAAPATGTLSPYAGQETRPIAGLSAERLSALRTGTGHGLALPAELNHYPGPRHLLDLGAGLALTASQTSALGEIFDRMHARAIDLGERIIAGETELDRLFAGARATQDEVARLAGEIAQLEGELRTAHLLAHVEARAVLTAEQVARYDAARGYAIAAR